MEDGGTRWRTDLKAELRAVASLQGAHLCQSVWEENPEGRRHKSGAELEGMAVICGPRQGPLREALWEEICADASVNLGSSPSVGAQRALLAQAGPLLSLKQP